MPVDTVKGRKKSISALVEKMAALADHPEGQTVYISHGDCPEDAQILANLVRERFPGVKEILIGDVGPVIGSHSGLGTLALFFLGTQR